MENKSNEQNLNNIDYNEFARKIKMKSPIHKTNLDSGPNFVLGMHVITLENATKETPSTITLLRNAFAKLLFAALPYIFPWSSLPP